VKVYSQNDLCFFSIRYIDPKTKRSVGAIVFRGSVTLNNWVTNLHAHVLHQADPTATFGFYEGYKALRQAVIHELSSFNTGGAVDEILITGHSLGGALATVCAKDIMDSSSASTTFRKADNEVTSFSQFRFQMLDLRWKFWNIFIQ
jgi:hypothetical protein